MKYKIILILLLTCSTFAFSQKKGKGIIEANYECSWSMKFIDDTIKMIQGIEDRIILQIGDDLSYQYSYNSQQWDSTSNSVIKNYSLMKDFNIIKEFVESRREYLRNSDTRESGAPRNSFWGGGKLYKDYKSKKIKVVDQISIHWFAYEESLIPQNWEIMDDTTTIAGYFCQKAVCDYRGRSYEAWFASEIPISEGPWKFYGLPGLIIKLYDTQRHYEFDLEEFKSVNNTIDINVLTTNKIVRSNRTFTLTKVERKKLLSMQWGEQGNRIAEAEMAKVGISHTSQARNHDHIERDYK